MDNHYHLILELKERHLSLALQWLNLSYSAWSWRSGGMNASWRKTRPS
jgi:hypothetical protein